jgi:Host cell surface-exposed lipoprotein
MSTINPPEYQQSPSQPPPEVQPPPRKRHRVRKTLLIIGGAFLALILLIVVINVATGGHKTAAAPPLPTATPTSVTDPNGYACANISPDGLCAQDPDTAAPAATAAPATSAPPASTPATSAPTATAPAMSAADQQAGSGFTSAEANFAISYIHPDWYQQAVEAAKGYMSLGGFSRDSLIQQLTSNYGNGFTYGQAEYAANQVGL